MPVVPFNVSLGYGKENSKHFLLNIFCNLAAICMFTICGRSNSQNDQKSLAVAAPATALSQFKSPLKEIK